MSAASLVETMLSSRQSLSARSLIEASVHLPRRGKRWVASYRDETGRQRWRSTGRIDRKTALVLAKQWEEEARRKRGVVERPSPTALIRVKPGSGKAEPGQFTQREVALLLRISERAVRQIERRAIAKLRRHPILRDLWRDWVGEELSMEALPGKVEGLTPSEIAAVYGLARTPGEQDLVQRLLACIDGV